ncbi:MAG: malonyl-CoA O-methyltransferase [Gammaproteobacteria bacterium]|jgi:malonyl-CoA O-methyltransferase
MPTLGGDYLIDVRNAQRAFNIAAETYDEHAALQRAVADNLLESLDIIRISPQTILEIGAATGYCAKALAHRYPRTPTLLLDSSPAMLRHARHKLQRWRSRERYIGGDAQKLPLVSASIDFIISSMTFHWCNDLDAVFGECHRVLKPNGLLLFSSLGPDTLRELREAWSSVDSSPHVNMFIDMHDVGDALIRAGFTSPILECDKIIVNYDDVNALMCDLRHTGSSNSISGRKKNFSTRGEFTQMEEAYERFRIDTKLPATFEVVYAHGWKPERGSRAQDGSTVATFPFADLKRR